MHLTGTCAENGALYQVFTKMHIAKRSAIAYNIAMIEARERGSAGKSADV